MSEIQVELSESSPTVIVPDVNELQRLLDEIESTIHDEPPIIVFIYAHDYQIGLGLGGSESFLHFEHESGESPYIISVGDDTAEGILAFYLLENHHTEISRRNLISPDRAREGLYYWIKHGVRPTNIAWEEI